MRYGYNWGINPAYLPEVRLIRRLARGRCAQTGLELLMYISFSLLVFSGFYIGILKKDINVANNEEALRAEDISERIAFEISTAKNVGNGYSRNFTLVGDVFGTAYSVRFGDNSVLVDIGDKTYASYATTSNVTGNIVAGCNSINNAGGTVSITSC